MTRHPPRNTRSPLAHAIGLGSTRSGVAHWWALRVSAIALVPLTLWFAAALILHTGSSHSEFVAWLRLPLNTIAMVLLLVAAFHHTALGVQVVIEDYMHSTARFAALLLLRLGCIALALAGILATLGIAFNG
ncbi:MULTISPECIES: succinate dehydrogenase, hydrophobic membrane anchor protein [unclassified Luteimonas]